MVGFGVKNMDKLDFRNVECQVSEKYSVEDVSKDVEKRFDPRRTRLTLGAA